MKTQQNTHGLAKGCLITGLILFVLPVLGYLILVMMGSFLINSETPWKANAIAVLSGDEGDRVIEAVDLYKKNNIQYFVITKTDQEDIGEGRTYSEALMRIAIDLKVHADSMFVTEGESATTFEEAQALLTLANKRNIQSYLVVTDPYHTRRTASIFNQVFANSGIEIRVYGIKNHWYDPFTWMFKLSGWKVTLGEYFSMFVNSG